MSGRREIEMAGPDVPLAGVPLRTALLVAFGLTVAVWAAAGVHFSRHMADLDVRTSEVRERYLLAQRQLMTARTQVLLSSVLLRDAVLDRDRVSAETARAAVERALDGAAASLNAYDPNLESPAEVTRLERLRTEIGQLRRTMHGVLASDATEWSARATPLLRGQLAAGRQAFMVVAGELGSLNRASFVDHNTRISGLYRRAQRRTWEVFGGALLLSLAIVLLAVRHVGRLEREVAGQNRRGLELQQGLQRLSSELIRVREEERRTIARELHDEVGQSLTAIKFEIAAAQHVLDETAGPAGLLDDVRPIVERTLQTVRDLSHMLHPAVLDDIGLSAAVDLHIKEFRRRHDIGVEYAETGLDERLPREVETVAYRIVQEALTNVAKHSRAATCVVSLVRLAHSLVVVVGDDGAGFECARRPAMARRGLGLVSMQERAMQLGGSLVVESAPGEGTRIVAELPLPETMAPVPVAEDQQGPVVGSVA